MEAEKHIKDYVINHGRKSSLLYNNNCFAMYVNPSDERKTQYEVNREFILKHFDLIQDNPPGILHSAGNYYVSNEGTKAKPDYHVWIPGCTHSTCDSAYADLSLATARCNYLYANKITLNK